MGRTLEHIRVTEPELEKMLAGSANDLLATVLDRRRDQSWEADSPLLWLDLDKSHRSLESLLACRARAAKQARADARLLGQVLDPEDPLDLALYGDYPFPDWIEESPSKYVSAQVVQKIAAFFRTSNFEELLKENGLSRDDARISKADRDSHAASIEVAAKTYTRLQDFYLQAAEANDAVLVYDNQ